MPGAQRRSSVTKSMGWVPTIQTRIHALLGWRISLLGWDGVPWQLTETRASGEEVGIGQSGSLEVQGLNPPSSPPQALRPPAAPVQIASWQQGGHL